MPELSLSRPTSFCDACAIRNRAICADLDDREIGLLNPPLPVDGHIAPPETPGWGAEWDRAYFAKKRVAEW